MEVSVGGTGYRATINSYMFGDAKAIARIAEMAGRADLQARFRREAADIKRLLEDKLWDERAQFFKVLPRGPEAALRDVRELHGYTPWYFNLPEARFDSAWRQLMDPQGFFAPFGPTTTEQRNPGFQLSYSGHECQWNGPSWPFATSVTLVGLANLLNAREQPFVSKADYFTVLQNYVLSHRLRRDDGVLVPWIDENLNPRTGDWIARTLLKQRGWPIPERGKITIIPPSATSSLPAWSGCVPGPMTRWRSTCSRRQAGLTSASTESGIITTGSRSCGIKRANAMAKAKVWHPRRWKRNRSCRPTLSPLCHAPALNTITREKDADPPHDEKCLALRPLRGMGSA